MSTTIKVCPVCAVSWYADKPEKHMITCTAAAQAMTTPEAALRKSLDDNFTDWENDAFGFGYGSGEEHTIPALKAFFVECKGDRGNYDYTTMEAALTPTVAWLLLNLMGHQDIIEYGTSPRYGWLTPQGQKLKVFVDSKSVDELLALTCRDSEYNVCYRNTCNCGPNSYQEGLKCGNPFWRTT